MIIFGTRFFGDTDAVPGLFYVSTKFFHVDFIPLFPIASYIVLRRRVLSVQGVEIPLSLKSIAIAWLRFLAVAGAAASLIWLMVSVADDSDDHKVIDVILPTSIFLAAVIAASLALFHKSLRNASYERATELASKLGAAGPRAQVLVDRHFGRNTSKTSMVRPTTKASVIQPIPISPNEVDDQEDKFTSEEYEVASEEQSASLVRPNTGDVELNNLADSKGNKNHGANEVGNRHSNDMEIV
uniref:Uncharacterized protein n=1 Tax=Pseudictyota dubia TaxID=2749911 RepID=A0A7R9Z3L7_9STRA|mmetsp:Transcript_22619/g.42105  ORF Transcript_22619/g.42105 Transcript_22619/m.42105 type:complete len:241 (+) Transcript_22619:112-834(+)|eukprot:CAMPEP_0197444752 /NCGR_PEP_ID=MMETSP1175-20131217/10156_1 /TAXON_ID=1003142 /ORGANISM="Triceratium dubium, Strain CCMP147" /LENGTH=240 /DNA_ID=CAMNT_0042975599 /DNA_START=111 /DNA_END=833 /DNA_ORIENTATION=+